MTDVRWLSPAERATWLAYVAATTVLETTLDRQLQRDSGMPLTYYQVLVMLSEAPERSLRMGELAAMTLSSQSRLSHAVGRLERDGWVVREQSATDRRSTFARLTERGYAALVAAAPGHVAAVRRHLFDRLSDEQVEQLRAICTAIGTAPGREADAG